MWKSDGEKKKIEKLSRTKLLPKAIFFNVNVNLRTRKKKNRKRRGKEENFPILFGFLEHCPHTLQYSFSLSLPKQFIIGREFFIPTKYCSTTHYLNLRQKLKSFCNMKKNCRVRQWKGTLIKNYNYNFNF
jgi:hypothetical protein